MSALQSIVEDLAAKTPGTPLTDIFSEGKGARADALKFVKQLGSVEKAIKYIKGAIKSMGKLDPSGANRGREILDQLKSMPKTETRRSFGEVAAEEAAAREAFQAKEEEALKDFTAEVESRAREAKIDNLSTRRGIHENTQIPETPDQLWETVNSLVPGMLTEEFETVHTGVGGTPTYLHAYDGSKKLVMFQVLKATKSSVVVRQVAVKGKTRKSEKVVPQKGSFISAQPQTIRLKRGQVNHPSFGNLSKWKGKPMAPLKEDAYLSEAGAFTEMTNAGYAKALEKLLSKLDQVGVDATSRGIDVEAEHGGKTLSGSITMKGKDYSLRVNGKSTVVRGGPKEMAAAITRQLKEDENRRHGGLGNLNTPDALFESCLGQGTLTEYDDPEVLQEAKKATVGVFLTLLTHKITRADMAQEKRDMKQGRPVNIHSLPLMLGQVGKVQGDVKGLEGKDDAESLGKLSQSIAKRFNAVSPIKYVLKAISDFLASGKMPMIRAR